MKSVKNLVVTSIDHDTRNKIGLTDDAIWQVIITKTKWYLETWLFPIIVEIRY